MITQKALAGSRNLGDGNKRSDPPLKFLSHIKVMHVIK